MLNTLLSFLFPTRWVKEDKGGNVTHFQMLGVLRHGLFLETSHGKLVLFGQYFLGMRTGKWYMDFGVEVTVYSYKFFGLIQEVTVISSQTGNTPLNPRLGKALQLIHGGSKRGLTVGSPEDLDSLKGGRR